MVFNAMIASLVFVSHSIEYADFAVWEHARGPENERALSWWNRIEGTLPLDHSAQLLSVTRWARGGGSSGRALVRRTCGISEM